MSQPDAAPQVDQSDSSGKKSGGCVKLLLLTAVVGVLSVAASLWLIDSLNLGGKIKTALREVIHPPATPAATAAAAPTAISPSAPSEPVLKVVERVVEVPVEKVVEKVVEVEVTPPMSGSYVPWRKIDTVKLWNGIKIENSIDASQGGLASEEREREDAFKVEMKLTFKIPKASETLEELQRLNSHLPAMLPSLGKLLETAEVSPFYHHLYERKTARIQETSTRFDRILSVHNLYDTETILHLENSETGQKALLIQSEMDVVSDGSDGDRWPFLDNYISMSKYYQPFTSYGWAKRTKTPNPLLKRWESELEKHKKRFAVKGLSVEENRFLRSRLSVLPREIEDMKARSYLIAEADPFIVLSLSFLGRADETPFGPKIGDYAVVIHQDKFYPCIVGDAGPTYKAGEASLRIAKEINPKASPYSRPVSDLEVTYLVFPNSREEKNSPPNLEVWQNKCQEYLEKLGGVGEGYQLHQWEDLVAKKLEEWQAKNPAKGVDQILARGNETSDSNGGDRKESGTGKEAEKGGGEEKDKDTEPPAKEQPGASQAPKASLPKPKFSTPVTPVGQ